LKIRFAKLMPVAVACGMAGSLPAQESEAPDLSFLEYLGSWEDGDDEWLVVAELAETGSADESDDDEAGAADDADDADDADEADENDEDDGRNDEADEADAD
jgi:hypothetical protein